MEGKRTETWTFIDEYRTEGMMVNWSKYMSYIDNSTYSADLILENPSFESDDILSWELFSFDEIGVEVTNRIARTGSNSIHIEDENTSASKWATQLITVNPNTTYTVTGYTRIISGYQALYVYYLDENYNTLWYTYSLKNANSNWEETQITSTSNANAAYMRISLYSAWAHTSDGYWDDISVAVGPPKTGSSDDNIVSDLEFSLGNYPNPFNPNTLIEFSIPEKNKSVLKIYNTLGKEVATLWNKVTEAGSYSVSFDASTLPSGVYFYTLQSGKNIKTNKMLLLK